MSTRGGPDFGLCCRLRLPATSLHDLVHRRPGQKCAGGAFYAKGMHHEVVQQLCRRQIKVLAGRPSYGLLKEVDGPGKPFSRNHGEQVPGGQVRSNTPCGRDVRRNRPGRTKIAGQSRFANPTTTWLLEYIYDGVHHTPLGRYSNFDFSTRVGCQYRTIRIRKAPGEMFPTTAVLARTLLIRLWRYRSW